MFHKVIFIIVRDVGEFDNFYLGFIHGLPPGDPFFFKYTFIQESGCDRGESVFALVFLLDPAEHVVRSLSA